MTEAQLMRMMFPFRDLMVINNSSIPGFDIHKEASIQFLSIKPNSTIYIFSTEIQASL